jgi:mono/diheme cytochrome c family protein
MKFAGTALLVAGSLAALAIALIYAGVFNVAADAPHWPLTYTTMDLIRARSIAVRARNVQVPQLDDAALIATGARHYAAMCSDCHLAPDEKESDIRTGLYPRPPDLTRHRHANPAEAFWIIKHGIKMSGMPAWGKTHEDSIIWGLVAFLQKLPDLNLAEYRTLVKAEDESSLQGAPTGHDHTHATDHSDHRGQRHDHEQ